MFALLPLLAILGFSAPSSPVKWHVQAMRSDDGLVRIELRAEVEEGWHIYATSLPSDEGPIATGIRFKPSADFRLKGSLLEPEPVQVYDPNFGMQVRYHEGSPVFAQAIAPARAGSFDVEGEVEYMVCNDKTCLPPVVVPFKLRVETLR
jgi:thiol:disulfide interchange protein DsbD